jgi:hypothetical protein
MGKIEEVTEDQRSRDDATSLPSNGSPNVSAEPGINVAQEKKKTFWQRVKEPGSVWQIIIAALLAIAIGLIVTTQVESVHPAAIAIVAIPGTLWLRALRAVGTSQAKLSSYMPGADIYSAPNDCHSNDHGHSTLTGNDPRWWEGWKDCTLDHRLLRIDYNSCRHPLLPACGPCLVQAHATRQW